MVLCFLDKVTAPLSQQANRYRPRLLFNQDQGMRPLYSHRVNLFARYTTRCRLETRPAFLRQNRLRATNSYHPEDKIHEETCIFLRGTRYISQLLIFSLQFWIENFFKIVLKFFFRYRICLLFRARARSRLNS